jgi:cytidyltransferase-like protein
LKREISLLQKRVLCLLLRRELLDKSTDFQSIAEDVDSSRSNISRLCEILHNHGMVKLTKTGPVRLTEKGRQQITVVFTGGTFDIIHPGHIHTLKSSRALGDLLVVSIARDSTVAKNKGHSPTNNETERVKMISAIRYVDAALLGSEDDIFEIVMRVKPQIITLGYDQKHDQSVIIKELAKRGLMAQIVRLDSPVPDIKSSKLLKSRKMRG